MTTDDVTAIYTFGDSILDCSVYTGGITPAELLARNDDAEFPEFRGRDLSTLLRQQVDVVHRAENGATVADLPLQTGRSAVPEGSLVLLTIGGNDLLTGLARDPAAGLRRFQSTLRGALDRLGSTRLFVGNVYDPSFGDDAHEALNNRLGVDPALARRAYGEVNEVLRVETTRAGGHLVDLHAHFLTGDPTWFEAVIEPSRTGASEVRRVFLAAWEASRGR